ncbi:TonB-dependent siderophore receptor [Variovorax paradoxus]|uniref:TonB-dependent siderophore receptor n=1 Tax=Variovorax paradoxus (strain EPS) TaxID=595537 RepID=E6UV23_VARPE|nr:TonB-dependent siderophore receptor [Variovorax paradoxus]ADU37535.1 TonB-dependent siderophore receptor [Variovorax paradoxus EPS]
MPSRTSLPRGASRHLIAVAVLGCIAQAGQSAMAQDTAATRPPQATSTAAGAGAVIGFSIPAQPLDQALNQLARQANLQLLAPSALLNGLRSRAIRADLSVGAATSQLLQGTGLTARMTGNMLVIERATQTSDTTLPAVTVNASAERETAIGPVPGYVARRSQTATKTDTPLLEVPQSISVIGREEMDARGVQDIMEAVRYTPGVTVNNWGFDPRGIEWILMRGFDTTTGIAGYRDGLVLPAYSVTEPYGVERVEVLRGPSSVTFGQGDAGGIINRVSKMPSNTPVNEVEVRYGNFQRKQLALDLGGVAGDTLSYRLLGVGLDTNSQMHYGDGTPFSNKRTYLAPSLRWQPSADTSFTLLGEFLDNKASDDVFYVMDNAGRNTGIVRGDPKFSRIRNRQESLGYLFEHHVNDNWTVRHNLRYSNARIDKHILRDALLPDDYTLTRSARSFPEWYGQWSSDAQLQGRVRTGIVEHTLLFGFDATRIRYTSKEFSGPAPSLDLRYPVNLLPIPEPLVPASNYTQITQQLGIYAQDQIKIDDRWVLTLSGRQDRVKSETTDRINSTRKGQADNKFSGRAGLSYLVGNGWAPYVSYATSFMPTSGVDLNGNPLQPTRGKQVEAGIKYQPEGSRTSFTAAVFDLRKSNVVTYDQNTFESRQIGRIRSRGLELEAKAELARNLNLTASYTVLNMKVLESANTSEVGKMPIQVPKQSASLWLDYTLGNGIGFGGGVRYIGRRWNDVTNTSDEGGVALLDATVHYKTGPWRFALSATNLANRKYTASRAYNNYYSGNERTLVASAKYQF